MPYTDGRPPILNERDIPRVVEALRTQGTQAAAARVLHISRHTLRRFSARHGIKMIRRIELGVTS